MSARCALTKVCDRWPRQGSGWAAQPDVSLTPMALLLEPTLPTLSIRLRGSAAAFMDGMEAAARSLGAVPNRAANYVGPGTDLMSVRMSPPDSEPNVKLIYSTAGATHVRCDVVARWSGSRPNHDEYVSEARRHIGALLSGYRKLSGQALRLVIGSRDPLWDWDRSDVECGRLLYPQEKLDAAIDSLTLGAGDIKERLSAAFLSFHVLTAADFPGPLAAHYEWIRDALTAREPRFPQEGSVRATLSTMRKDRAVDIAKRIVALREALKELCP